MPQRRMLFVVLAIAAAALAWYLARGTSREMARGPAEGAGVESAATRADRGAGERSALPGKRRVRVGVERDVAAGSPGAPSADPSGAAAAAGTDGVQDEWSGPGVEAIPPPRIGRDPRDSEQSGQPPDPGAIAVGGQLPAGAPGVPQGAAAPVPGTDVAAPEPDTSMPGSSGEAVPTRGPLTPEQVQQKADQVLADLPPDQRQALEPSVVEDIEIKSRTAAGLTGWTPSDPAPAP